MPRYDFTSPRLFVAATLEAGAEVALDRQQANYLRTVLRLAPGAGVLAFDGRSGEWQAELLLPGRSAAALRIGTQARPQPQAPTLTYCFAPLKHTRLDYMVQKAVEMGAGVLQPVITRRTQVARVNLDRMRANVIEAAEQCGILHVPDVREPAPLDALLRSWPADTRLVFCDEDAAVTDPIAALQASGPQAPLALLIGPEGGFDPAERTALGAIPSAIRLSLGPRILRADTAAVAALAIVQSALGDWR
jgi:16S rRNA (uracil1498-N3)-methyltransferase